MLGAIGIVLVSFGVVAILLGDRRLPTERRTWRLFDISPRMARLRKWLVGLGAIYAGLMVIRQAGWFS